MPHWISETILAVVNFIPALFVAEDSPNFMLIRAMFGLLLIVLVMYLIAMRPIRSAVARYMTKISKQNAPKLWDCLRIPPTSLPHKSEAKKITGPPPQPTLPAVRHAIVDLIILSGVRTAEPG
jgi:hypothetical protein